MASQLPSRLHSARLAWTDLAATVRSRPRLAAIAVVACTATSLVTLATVAIAGIQAMIFDDLNAPSLRIAFAPIEGAMSATTYVLLVLIASRFYLALGDRLSQARTAVAWPPHAMNGISTRSV
jgi:hypothetical protein